ncbi:MAG: hypothetical protein P1P69_04160 [Methanosarcinaceae archaeon]|nr:hypothetical protein [Methanosarcinaceae archaeon]
MAISEDEYQEHIQNVQHHDPSENVGYSTESQFLSDEMKYTGDIIKDDLWEMVADDYLEKLCLKKRTVEKLKNYLRVSTSFEIVLNNYTGRDLYRERLGLQLNSLYISVNISGLEKSYNDIDMTLINNEIHHRTKVIRGSNGFERQIQKTNLVKSTARSILGASDEPVKTGIARYTQGRHNK